MTAWPAAARLIARWLDRRERIDTLLEPALRTLNGSERARCQHLVLGVVRHFGRIEAALARLVAHPPRFATRAALFIAGYEIIEAIADDDSGRVARIVHHAVEQTKTLASPAEARLVNAVVRKLATALAGPAPTLNVSPDELGEYFSHPAWLVRSWLVQIGPAATRALLEWNQRPAPVHARWRAGLAEPVPAFLRPTRWPTFFEVESGKWSEVEPLLKAGKLYLQDPSARLPVDLLAPQPAEAIIDLCAAPGGKALLIADRVGAASPSSPSGLRRGENAGRDDLSGRLVAVDLPANAGPPAAGLAKAGKSDTRLERLKENLSRVNGMDVALVQGDLLQDIAGTLREHQLPAAYAGVLLDVPCSNTGVMRHRVDVKWRLQPGDFKKHPAQQLSMLHAAARLVAPGGRLVYSTCSLDAEENEHVVRAFLAGKAGGPFELEKSVLSYPWVDGHDGAASFLLRRTTPQV